MSKYRQKNGTPEVHFARSKLDGVLQTLVTKTDESPMKTEEDLDDHEDLPILTPPRRPLIRQGRKRKRGKDDPLSAGPDMGQYHHTYVMKLFDRSVDLAQFEDTTPLYPICRAWMRNQPHNRNLGPRGRSPTPEPESPIGFDDEDELGDIYRLPSPIPVKTERGYHHPNLRVSSPVPQPDDALDIHADPDTAPAPEQILLNHMVRWKQTRQKWREASRRREGHYVESLELLKRMYDKQ